MRKYQTPFHFAPLSAYIIICTDYLHRLLSDPVNKTACEKEICILSYTFESDPFFMIWLIWLLISDILQIEKKFLWHLMV